MGDAAQHAWVTLIAYLGCSSTTAFGFAPSLLLLTDFTVICRWPGSGG